MCPVAESGNVVYIQSLDTVGEDGMVSILSNAGGMANQPEGGSTGRSSGLQSLYMAAQLHSYSGALSPQPGSAEATPLPVSPPKPKPRKPRHAKQKQSGDDKKKYVYRFPCNKCKTVFERPSHLKNHQRLHTGM